ncbi:MAG: lytic transglycosylase domain-containing protein [Pseudomonadota bacterium]
MANSAQAADPPPFPEFTFKRIGNTPQAGGKRITVQIDPTVDVWARPEAKEEEEGEDVAAVAPDLDLPDVYGAFWTAVSPRLEDASPGRLEQALVALQDGGGPGGPRLEDMRRITEAYGRDILRLTVGTKVSPALVAAIISVESSGRPEAVSSAGATGLMQLMPATAERFGVENLTEPAESIRGGVAYLDWLMGEFGQDPVFILAGYNAGEGAVRSHGGVPPYAETRAYVPKVLAAWKVAAGLCLTRPELISDGCVFLGGS